MTHGTWSNGAPGLLSLGRDSLTFAIGGLAYKGIALLAVPLLARLLAPEELGLLDLAALVASIAGLLAALGIDQALAYSQPRVRQDGALWSSSVVMVMGVSTAIAAAFLALQVPLAEVLTGDRDNGSAIAAAGVYGLALAVSSLTLATVRLRRVPNAYAAASFFIVLAEMSLALVLAWFLHAPVWAMVLGWALGALLIAVPTLIWVLPKLARPQAGMVVMLIRFGAPLVPAAASWLLGEVAIRTALAQTLGLLQLGQYGIAFRVSGVLTLIVTGFGIAWYPYLYGEAAVRVIEAGRATLPVLLAALASLGAAITLVSPELIEFVAGAPYAAGAAAVAPLMGGAVALGAFVLMAAVVSSRGSTKSVAIAAVGGALIQAVSAAPLIAALGLAGAGLASMAGYAGAAIAVLGLEPRLLGPKRTPLALAVASAVLLLVAAHAGQALPFAPRIGIAGVTLLAVIGALSQSDHLRRPRS